MHLPTDEALTRSNAEPALCFAGGAEKTGGDPATLVDLVASFGRRGQAPAVYAFTQAGLDVVSYERLEREIREAAADLSARGVGPNEKVALCAPNTPEWIIGYFGIVCTGAAAIPMDYQSGTSYLCAVLAHARPKLLLTTRSRADELEQASCEVECLLLGEETSEPRAWRRAADPRDLEPPGVRPDDLASLLYTSGTTGTPKAVPLTHRNIASNLEALLAARLLSERDRVLLPLPLHHTYPFTVGLLTPLSAGASVVLPTGVSGPEIGRASGEAKATVLLAVPRLCAVLWSSIESAARGRGPFAARLFFALLGLSRALRRYARFGVGRLAFRQLHRRLGQDLRLIGCGGAKLDPALERNLDALGWRVLTGYGLTETSPVLTFNRPTAMKMGSEGRPLPGVDVRIAPAEDLAHGEIQARGPNVFAGYWRDEARTREVFTPDGWFKTGDLGWLDDDGFLHIAGRSKEVIVLPDGKNVYPEDIEKVYGESPLLREVAVLEHDHALAALVVPDEEEIRRQGAVRGSELIRDALETLAPRLARYQRVSAFRVTREPLPRTQLGKLKRHELPERYEHAAASSAAQARGEPTEDERALLAESPTREIWQWLEQRYPDHDLTLDTSPQYDLRVDSLEWVSLTLELERRFDVSLTAEAVGRIMTMGDLLAEAKAAEPASERGGGPDAAPLQPDPPIPVVGAMLLGLVRFAMRVLYRVRVDGADLLAAERPLLFAPNHASYLDPPALIAALPWSRLRKTYWAGWVGTMHAGPLSRFVSRATRVFPVDPDRDLTGAIRMARALLEQGYDVVWFPEGRRSWNGALEPFQRGIGLLLEDSGALAVPVAIRGTFEAWSRHDRRPKLKPLSVTFGEPRSVEALRAAGEGEDDGARIRNALRDEVAGLLRAAETRGRTARG